MPNDFDCVWSKEVKVLQKSDRTKGDVAVEKLFYVGKKLESKHRVQPD